ncbi:hypothetical protein PILCRDRAFT_813936 [Piloderma croceum F 1598]|uniref:Uncharacterized protein n=1 Tax=Piloderma croceum (strain F 1598) TaxID=765440 RepID=A0A0C3BR19_PILCF|nr:hypothetical protein PILCRDRAFT_813936 [Piloderma croceum F 1598]
MADKHLPLPLHHTSRQIPFSRPATPQAQPLQIGIYGLGNIGYPMARNLAAYKTSQPVSSPPLLVYNRTVSKSENLVKEAGGEANVRIAQSAAQLVIECDVIITNLANDAVVKSVYTEFSKALTQSPPARNKIFVETSTIYPTLAGELDNLISYVPHSRLITCQVFGAPAAADKAQLVLIMSGDYRSKKEMAYLLVPAVGRKVYDLGENLEKAPTFKLIGNSIMLGCMEVVAEAQTLAEKSGIGAKAVQMLVRELLTSPLLISCSMMIAYGDRMVNDSFDGSNGFAINGGIKDASHMRQLTNDHNSPMPVIDAAYSHLLTARALHSAQALQGHQEFNTLDFSAVVAGTRVAAGLDGLHSGKYSKVIKDV